MYVCVFVCVSVKVRGRRRHYTVPLHHKSGMTQFDAGSLCAAGDYIPFQVQNDVITAPTAVE